MSQEKSETPGLPTWETIENQEIARLIPHRYPFLLVDRAIDYVPYKTITGIKNVTINEPFLLDISRADPSFPACC